MNSLIVLATLFCFAAVKASAIGHSGIIVQGPSAKSTIVGADGSVISSVAPGGRSFAGEHSGLAAHTAPVFTHVAAYSIPTVAAHSLPVAYSSPVVADYSTHVISAYSVPKVSSYSTAVVSHSAPVVTAPVHEVVGHSRVNMLVAGPSGTIATSKTVAVPAVVAAYKVVTNEHLALEVHGLYL